MNAGQGLVAVATELERRIASRRDFIAPTPKLRMEVADGKPVFVGLPDGLTTPLLPWAHSQVGTYTDIPKPYYDRMLADDPGLLATNVNAWFARKPKDKRLVRTLDGNTRAFLSNAFRPLDNLQLAESALPILKELGAQVVSANVSDTDFYLKAMVPSLEATVTRSKAVGDVIRGGIAIGNREVGGRALFVGFYVTRLICMNGAVRDSVLRQAHIGKRQGTDIEDSREFFTDTTRRLDDAAFWSKFRDVVRAVLTRKYLDEFVAKANEAADDIVEAEDVKEVVEVTLDRFALPEALAKPMLKNLITSGDLSRYGYAQALTAVANEHADYEQAHEMEWAGARIIELPKSDWKAIVSAATKKAA